jgi:hypothetical protein
MTRFYAETAFFWATFVAFWLVLYFWAVRPLLKKVPSLAVLQTWTGTWHAAVRTKFAGMKALLAARVSLVLTAFIGAHDVIAANITTVTSAAGIDWTPLTARVPGWAWPIILFADFWLIMKFREFTNKRVEAAAPAVVHAIVVTAESPPVQGFAAIAPATAAVAVVVESVVGVPA